MSAACHYLKDFDKHVAGRGVTRHGLARRGMARFLKEVMMKSELQIQREIDAEHERDEDRAIYGMMVLIAGLGMAILIGIAVIGAWAQ